MPSALRYSTAAPRPTVSMIAGVPASNLCGRSAQVQLATVGDRDVLDARADALGQQLPRHDVAVVLHLSAEDDIASAQVGAPPGVGDEIDRLAGVAREDDFAGGAGVDEARDLLARLLHARGGLLAEGVDAAM